VAAFSAFHDEPVPMHASLPRTAASLGVPAGRYVALAKLIVTHMSPEAQSGTVFCFVRPAPGFDRDEGLASVWNTMALTVVGTFSADGRFVVSCKGPFGTRVSWAKITAFRLDRLHNGYSP
jgi:hypothetical protein